MNQGNDPSHAGEDGVFQDGCLIFEYPGHRYRASLWLSSRRASKRTTRRVMRATGATKAFAAAAQNRTPEAATRSQPVKSVTTR